MPYTFNSMSKASVFFAANFIPVSSVNRFYISATVRDFSSVEGRREALADLGVMISSIRCGEELFGPTTRFPNDLRDSYLCDTDGSVVRLLTQLGSSLTMMRDARAKDVEAARTMNRPSDAGNGMLELAAQGSQDAKKAWDEARNVLLSLKSNSQHLYRRDRVEQEASMLWADPPAH